MRLQVDTAWAADLAATAAWTVAAAMAVLTGAAPLVRVPLALGLVLFFPGYALVALLYPGRTDTQQAGRSPAGPRALHRLVLALALSLAIVPLVGLALNYSPFGIRATSLVMTLAVTTVAFALLAWARRLALPPNERLRIRASLAIGEGRTGAERLLGLALALCIVLAGAAAAYALVSPRTPERFTELYVVGSGSDPDCLPTEFQGGAYVLPKETCPTPAGSVVLGLANHEGHAATYWIRLVWTNETLMPDGNLSAPDAQEVRRWSVTLEPAAVSSEPGQLHAVQHEEVVDLPAPPGTGHWRLAVQAFMESPPPSVGSDPTLSAVPYRHVHLWIKAS